MKNSHSNDDVFVENRIFPENLSNFDIYCLIKDNYYLLKLQSISSQINLAFVRISRTVFILIAGVPIVDTYPTASLVTTRSLMFFVIILNPVQLLTDLLEHLRNLQKVQIKLFFNEFSRLYAYL